MNRTDRRAFRMYGVGVSMIALAVMAQPAFAQTADAGAANDVSASPSAAGNVATPSAGAQGVGTASADDGGGDAIVVTGIRQSLASAQNIKRNADTIVDAITAEDIGALPDRSINEALQRIPGVAITRFAAPGDSQHFSVQGSGVQIRGLTYNRSEFNGRDAFSVSSGRQIGYNDVPAELAGSVEVFKNLTADLIEGGISGTVSINTRKPFDNKDRIIFFSASQSYGDLAERSAPSFVGLFSDQWDLKDGSRLGLLVGGSYFQQYSRADSIFSQAFLPRFNAPDDGVDGYAINGDFQGSQYDGVTCDGNNPAEGRIINQGQPYALRVCDSFPVANGQTVYAPGGAGVRSQTFNTRRSSITAAGQFESSDRRLLVTAQYLRSESIEAWIDHSIETNFYYNDIGNTFPAGYIDQAGFPYNPLANYTFDDNGVFTSGTIVRRNNRVAHNVPASQACAGGQTYCDYPQFVTPGGLNTTVTNRYNYGKVQNQDFALNAKFSPTDRLHLNLDGQYVKAKVFSRDDIVDTSTFSAVSLDLTGKTPQVGFLTPGFDANTYFTNPQGVFYNDAYNNLAMNDGEEWAFRGDVQYDLDDDSFLRSVRMGGRWAKRSQTVKTNDYSNWGSLSATWTDEGPSYIGSTPNEARPTTFDNFFRGGGGTVPPVTLLTDAVLKDHDALMNLLRGVRDPLNGFSYTPIEDRGGAVVNGRTTRNPNLIDGYFLPNEIYKNSEETYAGYVRADFGTQEFANGMKLTGNIGVRYVRTKDLSAGSTNFPQRTTVLPSGFADFASYCTEQTRPRTDGTVPSANQIPALCRATVTDAQRAAALAFANGAAVAQNAVNKFGNWLPSVNLRLDITPKVLVRFAASKAISRPDFGDLRNFVSLGFNGGNGVFEARAANPYLRPIKADQLDLSAEWYFARVGSLTATGFYKRLTDVIIGNSGFVRNFSNNGSSYDLALSGPANADGSSNIKGAELSYQQTYDFLPGALAGLGVQATYTYIKAGTVQVSPPAFRASTDPTPFEGDGNQPPIDIEGLYDNLPLAQLSKHNFNVSAFYDKYGIYARVAYSWRSKFLLNNRDSIFPYLPVYSDAGGQVDGSLFYTVNNHFKIGIQANNLLDQTTKTRFLLNSDGLTAPRTYFKSDRQFQLSVRLNM
ncbi:MAG TPA: TonB-dependent receptor [Sphingomonas sp.]